MISTENLFSLFLDIVYLPFSRQMCEANVEFTFSKKLDRFPLENCPLQLYFHIQLKQWNTNTCFIKTWEVIVLRDPDYLKFPI